jgi:hypothetical protein
VKEAEVVIAGKTYTLRYRLSDRREIEIKSEKGLWSTMTSGELEDQAIVVWAGLAYADRKLTPRGVIELFEQHLEQGGDYYPILKKAIWCLIDARVLGDVNRAELVRILGDPDEDVKKAEGGGDPKAGAVVASQNL